MSFIDTTFDQLDRLTNRTVKFAGGIMDFLDYSDELGESGNGMESRVNPETDAGVIDRANPSGVLSNQMLYIGAALVGVVVLVLVVKK